MRAAKTGAWCCTTPPEHIGCRTPQCHTRRPTVSLHLPPPPPLPTAPSSRRPAPTTHLAAGRRSSR
jgi:hypothetical protein